MILNSVRAGVRCPVCGARSCSCGPTPGQVGAGLRIVDSAPRTPGPHPIYRTWRGDFRLDLRGAIRQGLEPGETDALPTIVAKRFDRAPELLDELRSAYAGASMEARRSFLQDLAVIGPKGVAGAVPKLIDALKAAPAAPPTTVTEPSEIPAARVGDVLEYAGSDPERIAEALELERGGRNRKTLVAELERRLEEVSK